MNFSHTFRKLVALVASTTMLVATLPGYAAPVPLADAPPLDINLVKPNIMFTLDNSGSMSDVSVPDALGAQVGQNCFKNHIANPLYFNPNVTYEPPKHHDGVNTTTLPNAVFNSARWDGFNVNAQWRNNTGGGWFNTTAALNLASDFRADYEYNSGFQATDARQSAYYMAYTAAVPAVPVPGTCYPNASYTRVDVTAQNATVQQNFANWFSYYRSRMQAIKSAAGIAFAFLDNSYRVGFHTILNQGGTFQNVRDFSGTNRQAWYQTFYAQTPTNNTPLRGAHIRVGEYFRTGVMAGQAGSVDPIQYSCQANYHLMSTDGYWNETPNPAFAAGNVDNIVPTLPEPVTGLTPGAAWPRLYRENPAAPIAPAINQPTLSDIATFYWATDLRPGLINNVPVNAKDPASWQHVVLFGISIAAQGTLPFDPSNAAVGAQTLTDITNGTRVWPHPTNNSPSAIDDLWHATVNSRGNYFNVNSPQQLASALTAALNDISSRSGSAATAGLANPNLGASSNNIVYVPGYKSGEWTGELVAKQLDAATGLPTADLWKHATILDTQAAGAGWDTGRKLLTRANGTVVPLRFNSLTTAQKNSLGASVTAQQAVVNYLRGDRTNEDPNSVASLKFRQRAALLGDIVDSEPRAVAAPVETYSDSFNPGYSVFRTSRASRTPMVYFGANDGFFHAVNGEASGANAGREMWAYMPSFVFRNDDTGIAALTYKTTDAPPKKFSHKFYVNGAAFSRDVDFLRTSSNAASPTPVPANPSQSDWHTVLISGLGKGGNGYFALDITVPPTGSELESALASSGRVLWEFTDPDMGFTYGKPTIVKTARYGWVALLPGGYNNVNGPNAGKGIVYVVDVKTGTLLHKFITTDGSATNPLGLAHLDAFISDLTDYTASEIYAGDLFGNVWRFDVAGTGPYAASGIKFAQLRDASNVAQPITTYPIPYTDPVTGDRFVAVGTGKLYDSSDLPNLQRQTFYNLRDGNVFTPKTTGLPVTRADLTAVNRNAQTPNVSTTVAGWYQDLEPNGERVVTEIKPVFGIAIWFTITPSTDPCSRGGFGTAYARAGASANNKFSGAPFLGGTPGTPQYSGGRAIKLEGGKVVIQITKGDGTVETISNIQFPGGFTGTVVNYREVIE